MHIKNTHNNKKKIYNVHSLESWIGGTGSRQVARQSMLIVNELGYEVGLEVVLETV